MVVVVVVVEEEEEEGEGEGEEAVLGRRAERGAGYTFHVSASWCHALGGI